MISQPFSIEPQLFSWARERSRREAEYLEKKFPKLDRWESGEESPSLRDLERFAEATYTPFGLFFLPQPPPDELQIPDFRTMADQAIKQPSADLLETIAICEQRQAWFREYLVESDTEPVALVGSLLVGMSTEVAARVIKNHLALDEMGPEDLGRLDDPVLWLAQRAEQHGLLIMISGIVADNTHRPLDPSEFRGFALADRYAPTIFVNAADAKTAQLFTLVHELPHIGRNQSAVSNPSLGRKATSDFERWCNEVAAEFLVPAIALRLELQLDVDPAEQAEAIARRYRVSKLVILRRLFDMGLLEWDQFREHYVTSLRAVAKVAARSSGGTYYNSKPYRVSPRFARALFEDTISGRTLESDAYSLLQVRKTATFEQLRQKLGIV